MTIKTKEYLEKLRHILPGGVHYNFNEIWEPRDIIFKLGNGLKLIDIEDREYIDLYSNFGSNIFGHSNKEYLDIFTQEISKISSTTLSNLSLTVSEQLTELFCPGGAIRFSVTGTEAIQTAFRLARAFTGRQKILRFTGNYHGHSDNILGGKPFNLNNPYPIDFDNDPRYSKGLAENIRAQQTLIAPWNDLNYLNELLMCHHNEIACIITEPISINGGGIEPMDGYLSGMRELCYRYGIVLIFDEVITGFRVNLGGAQRLFGIKPDLTILGKALGGGLVPVSAIIGDKKIMDLLTRRDVTHAGTFNGYHAGLAAIYATLELLTNTAQSLDVIAKNGMDLQKIILDASSKWGVPIIFQGHPSCFYMHITDEKIKSNEEWLPNIKKFDFILQSEFLKCGVLLAAVSRCYPASVLSQEDKEVFTNAADSAFSSIKNIITVLSDD